MPLFPREHGAYGQLVFPLATSFAVAGVTTASMLIAVAVVAGFLLHEPLSVLLGRRGARAKRDEWLHAATWLLITAATAVGAGLSGFWRLSPSSRWSLALPLLPAIVVAVAIIAQREKSSVAEVAVAFTFSLVAVPICLAANASTSTALAVGIAFALVFAVETLAVRAIILGVRGGGDARAVRSTRLMALVLIGAGGLVLIVASLLTPLPWNTLFAVAPGLVAGSWLAMHPPAPTRLRTVGWTLVATSAATALILMIGLARTRS
jgi:hypothetical protein